MIFKHILYSAIFAFFTGVMMATTSSSAGETYNLPPHTSPGAVSSGAILKNVKQAQNGTNGQPVILRGKLISRLPPDRFWFQDSTGKIVVEIDDEAWKFIDKPVNAQTSVQLIGEIDRESTDVSIEIMAVLP